MRDHLITLALVYGISYQKIYNPLKMFSCLEIRCLDCINVTMKNMVRKIT